MKPLPAFPDMEPLEIEHKPVIDALLHKLQPETSELTFTNLYIWRHPYGLQVTDSMAPSASWPCEPIPRTLSCCRRWAKPRGSHKYARAWSGWLIMNITRGCGGSVRRR